MKYIGGFFELEKTVGNGTSYHSDAIALANGRACLNLILKTEKPSKVWVPFYTCDSLVEPIVSNGIPYEFYKINDKLEIAGEIGLLSKEMIVYVNYFGLKSKHVKELVNKYGRKLIIDNTQAFFERSFSNSYSFNSARKSVGVPDGGFLYNVDNASVSGFAKNDRFSIRHMEMRTAGKQKEAYENFVRYENSLVDEIMLISDLSMEILNELDYDSIIGIRKKNFIHYHKKLGSLNQLHVDSNRGTPFCYPLLLQEEVDKGSLFANGIFVPTFWPDALSRSGEGYELERRVVKNLLPLPVDHRYSLTDCDRVIENVIRLINKQP